MILSVIVLALTSCSLTNKQPKVVTPVYPETQAETPATKFCASQGGQSSVEKSGTLDIAYCTTKTGEKVDAWKYMSDMTVVVATGTTESKSAK